MALHDTLSTDLPPAPVPGLRPVDEVMTLSRLGSLHASRLSFSRSLMRQMIRERWQIECERFALDAEGYGDAIYRVATPNGIYRFVIFAHYLDPSQRSDRVIANDWDLAFVLCKGDLSPSDLEELRVNVPRQEAGRCSARALTLSRANRSQRNFEAVVERLADGRQPDAEWFENVGYLYRTTAVYGNGKFGIGDYEYLRQGKTFARPFAAELFTVYMVRHFAFAQVEHIARQRAPATAVPLAAPLKRYLGIGNSTGLGMAPFLISHPQLIDRWIHMRETAVARIHALGPITPGQHDRLAVLVERARRYIRQTHTDDAAQSESNRRIEHDLAALQRWLSLMARQVDTQHGPQPDWRQLNAMAQRHWSVETQELINSLLLELHPAQVNALEDHLSVDSPPALQADMTTDGLRDLIETHYAWALAYNFDDPAEQRYFWYRAATKEEPRVGRRGQDRGAEREMSLGVARTIRHCYDALLGFIGTTPQADVVDFLLAEPEYRAITSRIQTMATLPYGEIRANLLGADCRPLDLLRCKLSFFGAGKFDPRSDRWVRITLFQGAPLIDDLARVDEEFDWFMATRPDSRAVEKS